MAIESYFFNAIKDASGTFDRTYSAQDFTNYLDLLVGNGVFPNPTTNLQVTASSGMNIIVKAGAGWIKGHKLVNTADMIFKVDASDVLLNRIDRIVFYVDWSNRNMGISILKGEGATNPVAPPLTRNDTRYEMSLATIAVNKQVTAITQSMITDTRGNSSVCGWVQGLIQQLDSSGLFAQFDHLFNDWFSNIKEDLSTSTLLRKFEGTYYTRIVNERTFDVVQFVPQYNHNLDVLEVYVNSQRLNNNEYTMNGSVVTLVNALDVIETEVSFVVYKSIDGSEAERIIDTVESLVGRVVELEAKAPKTTTVTLSSSGWVSSGDVYTQTVNVPIIETVNDVVMVSPVENVQVRATSLAVGSLTFTAYVAMTSDVTINIVKMGV